ncbi:type II toxin-antitoxin system RelE/ParE family toxin [Mycobacterium sp. pUA109]|uniref:type II toxin-antitoxin system RelE/ParE family toxin n=1 Tax=Mycobacterium sp. pUA109 TaxID=3238982 RepID=UPI00351B1095
MAWTVVLVEEVDEWFCNLDPDDAEVVAAAIDRLEEHGPFLGRPTVDKLHHSKLHNLKELRPAGSSIRILFIFDPWRQAVLLVGGEKAGKWNAWYDDNIPKAEERYQRWLSEEGKRNG